MLAVGSEPGYFFENHRPRRSLWAAILFGLVTAISVTFLLCSSQQTRPSQAVVVLLAAVYLAVAALSGITGSYVYWIRSAARSVPGLAQLQQSTVRAWVWIPAVVLLFRKDSVLAPAVAAAGAAVLAISLRRGGPAALDPAALDPAALAAPESEPEVAPRQHQIFSGCPQSIPLQWTGPIVAVCVNAELLVLAHGWLFAGCALLAVAAFVFAWARTPAARPDQFPVRIDVAALRQARSAIPALAVTMLAMLAGINHDVRLWGMESGHAHGNTEAIKTSQLSSRVGAGGHVSVILLTPAKDKQFVAPHPAESLLQRDHLTRPMVIQFDGEYWYFQPPDSAPGPSAYTVRQDPLTVNIHSVTTMPLLMQAHQHLGSPLPLSCCHAIEVEIENRDQAPGSLELAMSLSDSTSPISPILLEVKPILSTQGEQWRSRSTPAHETLRFTIPLPSGSSNAQLRQFDQIDMLITPDPSRMRSGAKIAVRTLRLVP